MFIENYRRETAESIMAGGDARAIPYPKISDEDWRVWYFFLPLRTHKFDKKTALNLKDVSDIPSQVADEIRRGAEHFDEVEIWRKRVVNKDPIAVGVQGGDRYLIARWGMEKLIPFEAIKKRMPLVLAWKYGAGPLGAFVGLAGIGLLMWNFLS